MENEAKRILIEVLEAVRHSGQTIQPVYLEDAILQAIEELS